MSTYEELKALHASLPPFSPIVPTSLLPTLALVLLFATFVLGFYFSTLPKDTLPIRELQVASLASILGGFGVVALFCSVGVYV
ncbi:hypothetical protein CYLTODRAFT_433506 [Cylindrobasidium torrendii FP15055 ss-10]|uniref:Dolichyl-diphosphooligosaccharide-protein glycosyltransferase subunit OST5 n=1 Tax=Cylindrobasidium torrendii FP15055 ss-10 TaxID=1314674 RepID=A0A0D7ATR3_9AGAR|nr:hypothetical protein CYLTODRAFT_433506 [Cylindrobasidium torrendii FP15055 ss-10]